ncbi:MAG: autotransporter domain-containing protein, partial [Mycobacterium sp.]|nr:autotransporter domain-containing protein [Mycobacterium sp.]
GSSYSGATVGSGVTGLSVAGSTSGTALLAVATNDYVGGALAGISNTGNLSAATALYIASTGSLGSLVNSGTIAGNISNLSAGALSISGGTGSVVGTFTGGTISNTLSNVVLASGNLLLNDAVNVGTGTLVNSGASVLLQSIVSVTGGYSQTAGTLNVGGNSLVASGSASISGGSVVAGLSSTGNYLAGNSTTLVSGGAGSSYSGATVGSGVTGLSVAGSTSGTALLAVATNDYVGGALSGISNSGTLSAATALYIASTGSLGSLVNSGTIAGNISNLSTADLSISGGTDAAPGVLTGGGGAKGSISNSFANLRFVSGTQLINSAINVGSHAVINSGANLLINSAVNITGSYTQTAGGLVIGVSSANAYGTLLVSGTANLSGGSITLKDLTSTALAAGESFTIVQAGGGLSLGNLALTASGYTVTASTITSGGFSDLVLSLSSGTPQTVTSNYTAVGVVTGGSAVGTGAVLDKLVSIASSSTPSSNPTVAAFQATVLAPLAKLSAPAQQQAVAQLSPNQLTPQLTSVAITPTSTAIAQHQQTVASLMDSGGPGAAAGSGGQKGSMWGEVIGGGALRGSTPEAAGYKSTTTGLVVGGDWYATPELAAGVAFSWLNSSSTGQGTSAGSQTQVGSYQLTAYGSWRPDWADDRLTVDGQFGAGYNHFDQRRDISFLNARAKANYGGEQYMGSVTVGYDLPVQSWLTVTPQWRLRLSRQDNNSYSERGAGAANLQVDSLQTDSMTQELGLKLDSRIDTWLGKLEPDFRFAWVHDYINGPIATSSVMAGSTFTSTTGRTNPDGLALGVGATLQQSDEVSLRLEYDGELRSDYQSHTGVLRATFRF